MGIELPKFNEMTTGQKVATVAGTAAAVGAVAATVVAGVKGKAHLGDIKTSLLKEDKFVKKAKEGAETAEAKLNLRGQIKKFTSMMKEGFKDEWASIKKLFTKKQKPEAPAPEAPAPEAPAPAPTPAPEAPAPAPAPQA